MRPRKSDGQKKSNQTKLKDKRDKILARWTDGLFYFVKVIKLISAHQKCVVEFEDQSTANVHLKDLLEEKEEGASQCHYCGSEDVKPNNELVKCSNCERDYHQACHIPPITTEELTEKFVCRICVFASCAQAGGAKSSGPLAEKFAAMKGYFPYSMKYLTWNAGHTSNVEQYFCYCGGPGIWYNKMLQCCRCQQWFHEACIQSLKEELLIGDRFFIFTCSRCNYGEEFLQRMELDWLTIVHIAVFHLIMTMGTRYIDLDCDILPFVMDHMDTFGFKRLINGMHGCRDAVRSELLKILQKNNTIFCCGIEVKKRCTYFGVRERNPPMVPLIVVPSPEYVITAESLVDPSVKKTTFLPSKCTFSVPYVLRGAKKVVPPALSARLKESKLAKIARVKSEHNYCTPVKCQDDISIRRPRKSPTHLMSDVFDANNNSPAKPSSEKSEETSQDDYQGKSSHAAASGGDKKADGESATRSTCRVLNYPEANKKKAFWSLDTAFPEPVNFTGANHPFLTEFEQDNIRLKRKHFEEELSRLSCIAIKDEDFNVDVKSSIPLVPPPPHNVIRGFKGELAELLQSSGLLNVRASPKKQRSLQNDSKNSPEKVTLKRSPNHLAAASKKLLNSSSKPGSSCRSSLSPGYATGKKSSLKNGFTNIKLVSESQESEKQLKALTRCLKKLSPSCGFRFPVLESTHPSIASKAGLNPNHLTENDPSQDLTECSRLNKKSSLCRSKNAKGRKRKHHVVSDDFKGECDSQEDSVRRSNRTRHTVKRLEASLGCKSYDFYQSMQGASASRAIADQYEVVSLRIRPDNDKVEYLLDWSQP